jgi:MFS family permease
MVPQLVAVTALLLGSFLLFTAGGLHGLLLPTQGVTAGFSTAELGLIGTGWAIGFMAGCLVLPHLVRRIGHVRAFGALTAVAAVTILLNLLVVAPWFWIPLRAVTGFCFAGNTMIVESWLNERVTRDIRGRFFSVYQMLVYGASTAGQLLLIITPPAAYFPFVLGAILYCLSLLPTALSTAATPAPMKVSRVDIPALYRVSPVAAIGCLFIGTVNGAFGTLGPVYAAQIGLTTAAIATVMSGALIGGALLQVPIGRLSDRFDRRRILIGVAASAALISLAIAVIRPREAGVIMSLAIAYGCVTFPIYALLVAHANDYAAPGEFVRVSSGLLLLYGIGTMVGPVLAAIAMDRIAPEGLFGFTALMDAAIIGYTVYRIGQRPPQPRREPFQAIPPPRSVTPESAALDPRAADSFDRVDVEPVPEPARR